MFRLGIACASLTFLALIYTLAITFIFGRLAALGPRWLAATDLVLHSALGVFMGAFGLYLVTLARLPDGPFTRTCNGVIGALMVCIAATAVWSLPRDIADVVLTPTQQTVEIAGNAAARGERPAFVTRDGTTYYWRWAYGLYEYPRVEPGPYLIYLTAVSHEVVKIEPVSR